MFLVATVHNSDISVRHNAVLLESLSVLSPADTQAMRGLRTLQAEASPEAPTEAPGPEEAFLPPPSPEILVSQTPAQEGGTCVTSRAFQQW